MSNRLLKHRRRKVRRFPWGIDLDEAERHGLIVRTNCVCSPAGYLLVENGVARHDRECPRNPYR
jgi:hypothetical protein